MTNRRTLVSAGVLALLCGLIYLQVRTWENFEWAKFWARTHEVNKTYIILALAIIYFLYILRAVRWRIFLKPVHQTTVSRLIAPQFIGFAGLAMLGRPGEMIRPYLIARKESLTFSSQIAVWLVERIFDMGCVAIMFVIFGFIGDPLWDELQAQGVHHGRTLQTTVEVSACIFLAGIVAITVGAVLLRRSGATVASYLGRKLEPFSAKWAHGVKSKILAFTDGLQTVQDAASFLQLFALSMVMWMLVGVSFWLVVASYGGELAHLGPASILLLMVASMFGSLLQLPGVGGGSQLATIVVLNSVFHVDHETAVSCGMLLWVVTFMSVIPVGLLLARREHLSLRAIAAAEEKEEAALAE